MSDPDIKEHMVPEAALRAFAKERDAQVAELRTRAAHIEALSPFAFVLEYGLSLNESAVPSITHALVKHEWLRIEWMGNKPGWRYNGGGCEGYVRDEQLVMGLFQAIADAEAK